MFALVFLTDVRQSGVWRSKGDHRIHNRLQSMKDRILKSGKGLVVSHVVLIGVNAHDRTLNITGIYP